MNNPLSSLFKGSLFNWLDHINITQSLINSNVLAHTDELRRLTRDIANLIREGRKQGVPWVWGYEDIQEDVHPQGSDYDYFLPSVDLAPYLGLESNHKLKAFFKKHEPKVVKHTLWDTESSAWYPGFKTKEDAVAMVDAVNRLFDARYLNGKEKS